LRGTDLIGIMYFVDPYLRKNKRYYLQTFHDLAAFYGVPLFIFYGGEFFEHIGHALIWDELVTHLIRWKAELPDLPELNLDINPSDSFNEIKDLPLRYWRRLILNENYWEEGIMKVVFRDGLVLQQLLDYFSKQKGHPYQILVNELAANLKNYYPSLS